ncbi:MAG: hypothetical protein MI976_28140 [Pseudomonadales bacterium]|nr:hypothetical protein [Pseudomonadales bacterium]
MVPGKGALSNPNEASNSLTDLFAAWEQYPESNPGEGAEYQSERQVQEFFETLAEWNEYLENHVPFIKEANYDL